MNFPQKVTMLLIALYLSLQVKQIVAEEVKIKVLEFGKAGEAIEREIRTLNSTLMNSCAEKASCFEAEIQKKYNEASAAYNAFTALVPPSEYSAFYSCAKKGQQSYEVIYCRYQLMDKLAKKTKSKEALQAASLARESLVKSVSAITVASWLAESDAKVFDFYKKIYKGFNDSLSADNDWIYAGIEHTQSKDKKLVKAKSLPNTPAQEVILTSENVEDFIVPGSKFQLEKQRKKVNNDFSKIPWNEITRGVIDTDSFLFVKGTTKYQAENAFRKRFSCSYTVESINKGETKKTSLIKLDNASGVCLDDRKVDDKKVIDSISSTMSTPLRTDPRVETITREELDRRMQDFFDSITLYGYTQVMTSYLADLFNSPDFAVTYCKKSPKEIENAIYSYLWMDLGTPGHVKRFEQCMDNSGDVFRKVQKNGVIKHLAESVLKLCRNRDTKDRLVCEKEKKTLEQMELSEDEERRNGLIVRKEQALEELNQLLMKAKKSKAEIERVSELKKLYSTSQPLGSIEVQIRDLDQKIRLKDIADDTSFKFQTLYNLSAQLVRIDEILLKMREGLIFVPAVKDYKDITKVNGAFKKVSCDIPVKFTRGLGAKLNALTLKDKYKCLALFNLVYNCPKVLDDGDCNGQKYVVDLKQQVKGSSKENLDLVKAGFELQAALTEVKKEIGTKYPQLMQVSLNLSESGSFANMPDSTFVDGVNATMAISGVFTVPAAVLYSGRKYYSSHPSAVLDYLAQGARSTVGFVDDIRLGISPVDPTPKVYNEVFAKFQKNVLSRAFLSDDTDFNMLESYKSGDQSLHYIKDCRQAKYAKSNYCLMSNMLDQSRDHFRAHKIRYIADNLCGERYFGESMIETSANKLKGFTFDALKASNTRNVFAYKRVTDDKEFVLDFLKHSKTNFDREMCYIEAKARAEMSRVNSANTKITFITIGAMLTAGVLASPLGGASLTTAMAAEAAFMAADVYFVSKARSDVEESTYEETALGTACIKNYNPLSRREKESTVSFLMGVEVMLSSLGGLGAAWSFIDTSTDAALLSRKFIRYQRAADQLAKDSSLEGLTTRELIRRSIKEQKAILKESKDTADSLTLYERMVVFAKSVGSSNDKLDDLYGNQVLNSAVEKIYGKGTKVEDVDARRSKALNEASRRYGVDTKDVREAMIEVEFRKIMADAFGVTDDGDLRRFVKYIDDNPKIFNNDLVKSLVKEVKLQYGVYAGKILKDAYCKCSGGVWVCNLK